MGDLKIDGFGSKRWYNEAGELHRDDGPAMIRADGTQKWYQHNLLHRDDGPAETWLDGTEIWYQHGRCHRDDGPAMYNVSGGKRYSWYRHDLLHRTDGPAIIRPGHKNEYKWYIHGIPITSNKKYQELTGLSDEEMLLLIFKYGDVC